MSLTDAVTDCPCCGSRVERRWPVVDLNTNSVAWGRRKLDLEPKLAELLHTLVEAAPATATRVHLAEQMWGKSHGDRIDNTLSVYISNARRSLRTLGAPFAIETVWGSGFVLRPTKGTAAP